MSSGNNTIQPQAAPLTHLNKKGAVRQNRIDPRNVAVGIVVIVVVLGALFFAPTFMQDNPSVSDNASKVATGAQNANQADKSGQDQALAPFAATQLQRTREKAQSALAAFVEQQIELEENMDVQAWGQDQLRSALAIAEQGDAHFSGERYDDSLKAYAEATAAIREIVVLGNRVHDQHVADAQTAFDDRDHQQANTEILAALRIKPDAPQALALQTRINNLPEIIKLIRDAKNHELGGRPEQALAIYDQILTIDANFQGLQPLRQDAYRAQASNKVSEHLSQGFAALEKGQFDTARNAFNRALAIEPANDIALGGLAQVAKDNDLAIINQQRANAEQAIEREDWEAALTAYQAVLDLDANIQFARSGHSSVQAHAKSWDLLNKINAAPERLSNEKLYLEASDIVQRATGLPHAGPKLKDITGKVSHLLELYRDPVDVVLVSDNATDIIVSNVGRLGTFTRKSLRLRPGEYTIRGSQNGCRDIYLTVKVLPGIEPLDLSCPERL